MGKKTASLWSLGEPLFLGLSCLVGGEQFYILLYGTGRSVRAQSFVLIFTAIITCIMSVTVSSRTDILAHFFHLFYMSVLLLLIAISNEITSRAIVTTSIIALGYGMTVLVIQSCSLYSTSREELLSFILGMFSARYLPCFHRLVVSKGCTCDSKIKKLSMAVGISRLVFCIISLVLKIIMGRFELSIIVSFKFKTISVSGNSDSQVTQQSNSNGQINIFQAKWWSNLPNEMPKLSSEITNFQTSLKQGFTEIKDHAKYIKSKSDLDHLEFDDDDDEYFFWILTQVMLFSKKFFKQMPIVVFLTSVFIFLMYPKTSFSAYCSYSPKVISTLMNVKFVLHIIGSLFGIGYPVSVTHNSAFFATITFFFYYLITIYFLFPYADRYFRKYSVYLIVGSCSFVLGYMWSYSLGLLINIVLKETCVYEEVETIETKGTLKINIKKRWSCCGDKITSQCYCKLEQLMKSDPENVDYRMFECSKLFSEDKKGYSQTSQYGIILVIGSDDPDCKKLVESCARTCECSSNCSEDCCLKVVGLYKIDAVTVSSCSDCQMIIRLEGSCPCGPGRCIPSSSGGSCESVGEKCCCICLKCCNPGCRSSSGCCCIGFCKNESGCNKCIKKRYAEDARIFICYKVNGNKSCIKEIRPNDKADFVGDLNLRNVFDIEDIFISDCCHVDVKVDLKCTVKNNYFRLGGANYPRKFEKPDLLRLFWSESICCPNPPKTQCCCMFSRLVRGCVMFTGEEVKCGIIKKCKNGCSCRECSECCITPCDLIVDYNGGFVKRVDRIRVKLVVISWLFFGLIFFFVVLFTSMFRSKYSLQTFYPMTSYSKLAGAFVTNKYNTDEQVTKRILGLLVKGQITSQTVEAKKVELKAMLRMFDKYTKNQETKKTKKRKPKEVEKIHKYITSQATSFSPSSSIGGRSCELCVVEWSQCVGLVYKYAMPLFLFIQNFFVSWEEGWEIDFYNYKKQIMPYVTKVTHNSNISLSTVMSGVKVGDKSKEAGLNRLMTWNGTSKETKQLSKVKMKEDNMINESIPPKIGNRLCYYVRRWNHRLDNIRNWCKFESHVFDWAKFLQEYYKIREWVTDVCPGLRCDS